MKTFGAGIQWLGNKYTVHETCNVCISTETDNRYFAGHRLSF